MKTTKTFDEKSLKDVVVGALIANGDAVFNPTAQQFLARRKQAEEDAKPKVVGRNLRD